MSDERRQHTRLKLHVPLELRTKGSHLSIRGETSDLSAGGLYVEMMFTLEIGTDVDITLQLGDATVRAVGKVVTCDRTVGNGIQFVTMLPEDHYELERFLKAAETEEKSR
jgi:hypothetical protein